MQFVADSEFIFSVWAGGFRKLVSFGERSGSGVSVFSTNDPVLAQAIRNTRYFKLGRIEEVKEDTNPEAEATVTEPGTDGGAELGTPGAEGADTEQAAGEGTEIGNTEAEAESTPTEKEPEVMKFDSITFAKNYLAKEFGIDKKALKTPEQVVKAAEEKGIKIEF